MTDPDDLGALEGLAPDAPPPASLRNRILSMARGRPFAFIRHGESVWLPAPDAPVAVKVLLADARDRIATRLVRLAPSATMPPPALDGRRALFVVYGALRGDDSSDVLSEGDFVDEDSPRTFRSDAGALVIEWSQMPGGETGRSRQLASGAPLIAALPDGRIRPMAGGVDGPRSFFVLEMDPNATLAEHEHHGVEELLVLAGSCEVEEEQMEVGDYHRAASHSSHAPTRTFGDGCTLLVALRDPDRIVGA